MVQVAVSLPTSYVVRLLQLNAGLVGASTGTFEAERGRWPELLARAREVSKDVVELSALSGDELPGLLQAIGDVSAEGVVSVHGPAKCWQRSADALAEALDGLPPFVAGIVMHPETLIEPTAFERLGRRLRLENMDTDKPDGRTVAELARFYEVLPQATFCLDVAHAWLHDPTMRLAHDLLDAFGDRLSEVHISSIEADGRHVRLRDADALTFMPVLERCVGVPWVLEAPVPARVS
jgi:sugar phosphate isomerase/epimerase